MALRPVPTHPPDDEPIGALVSRVTDDVRRIVRAEVGLVQLRVEAGARAARASAGGFAAALVLALGGVGALVAALVLGIATVVPLAPWLAALVIGIALLVLGVGAGIVAVAILRRGLATALEPVDIEVTTRER